MKKLFFVFLFMVISLLPAFSQKKHGFDPKRFEADLEQYITTQATLSPREAARFFPVYREYQEKMRALFTEQRHCRLIDINNDAACIEALRKQDDIDIEMKKLQHKYHQRFVKILSPSKVFKIIMAEDRFHRKAFERAVKRWK